MNKAYCASFIVLSMSLSIPLSGVDPGDTQGSSVFADQCYESSTHVETTANELPDKPVFAKTTPERREVKHLKAHVQKKRKETSQQEKKPSQEPKSTEQEQKKEQLPNPLDWHQQLVAQNRQGLQTVVEATTKTVDSKLQALLERKNKQNVYSAIQANVYPLARFLAERTIDAFAQSLAIVEELIILKLTLYLTQRFGLSAQNN